MEGGRQKNWISQSKSSITGHYLFNAVTRLADLPFQQFWEQICDLWRCRHDPQRNQNLFTAA